MVKGKDVTKKDDAGLQKMLDETRQALKNLRFHTSGGVPQDVKAQKNLRKDIARILTEIRKRQLLPAEAA
jgi:ribosomal protein L29